MEFWARWAHRALWHASLWHMHEVRMSLLYASDFRMQASMSKEVLLTLKLLNLVWSQSHHRPREGPFELNDVFAIINAVPAIGLLSYGFFNKGLVPGLCFGAVSLPSPVSFFAQQIRC